MNRIISNAEKRKEKATPTFGTLLKSDRKYIRTETDYIENYDKINNNVINTNSKNIKKKVKESKKLAQSESVI